MRAAADDEDGDDDAARRDEALADPVLGGRGPRRVQLERLRVVVPRRRRLDDEAREHARLLLRQQEAAEVARALELVEHRTLVRAREPDDRAREQVELHREADAKPAQADGGQEAMGEEELVGFVGHVGELEHARAHEAPQRGRRLRGVRRGGHVLDLEGSDREAAA